MHTSVMLQEAITALNVVPGGVYIDCTGGEGGHTKAIREQGGTVLTIDIDPEQVKALLSQFRNDSKITVIEGNYANVQSIAVENGVHEADGILVDLGLSMEQLRNSGKGLSFNRPDEDLDMRLGTEEGMTAADIVNGWSVGELYDMFSRYSEEIYSFQIAESIAWHREKRKLKKVRDLIRAIDTALERKAPSADKVKSHARIFQALRIAVNSEFENIRSMLAGAMALLKPGGRLVVITFHSLEDRIVKQFALKNNIRTLGKKAVPGNKELKFERSAKMRILVKD